MIITYHNVEVKRCLAPFDTIARPENNAKNSAPQHCLFALFSGLAIDYYGLCTLAIVENNMHKEKEKREKHESGRTKKKTDGLHRGSGVWGRDECM